MKKIRILGIILIMFMLASCGDDSPHYSDVLLNKEFKIRKMMNTSSQNTSGGFFLFVGSVGSSTSTNVTFAWEIDTNKYINSTFNITRIVIELDTNIQSPVVEFGVYNSRDYKFENNPLNINWYIDWATIRCHPDQWKVDINLPYQEE